MVKCFTIMLIKKNWKLTVKFYTIACFKSMVCCWRNPILIHTHSCPFALEPRHFFSDKDELIQKVKKYFQFWSGTLSATVVSWNGLLNAQVSTGAQRFLSTFRMKLIFKLVVPSFHVSLREYTHLCQKAAAIPAAEIILFTKTTHHH